MTAGVKIGLSGCYKRGNGAARGLNQAFNSSPTYNLCSVLFCSNQSH